MAQRVEAVISKCRRRESWNSGRGIPTRRIILTYEVSLATLTMDRGVEVVEVVEAVDAAAMLV